MKEGGEGGGGEEVEVDGRSGLGAGGWRPCHMQDTSGSFYKYGGTVEVEHRDVHVG